MGSEMCIRDRYYVGRFLRTLLSPSLSSIVDPSGLIEALARLLYKVPFVSLEIMTTFYFC